MNKKRHRAWKKYIKFLNRQIEHWIEMWSWLENVRLPVLRSHIKDYNIELKNREVVPEFLGEYYGLLVEAEYLLNKEKNESINT